ncbi:MAG: 50S ribosomal protein L24 [Bacillota bacterium]|nr:50S ribosomal protein L24 [Bacillota bacterium]
MHIKKDDTVLVLTGKDKGKKGKVLKVMPKRNMAIVEGVNIQTKHRKPNNTMRQGAIEHKEGPVHVSNLMYFDKSANAPTRIGYEIQNGKKVRVSKKTGKVVD